ncbi:MAG: elongation factor G [Eubacteriales bacterium]|nr:elongation factor G [Eubacteriales bacterium]
MKLYKTEELRNIVVLGHYGHGKTTLVEAIANFAGLTDRPGRVEDGNTISDFSKEETTRGFSISTAIVPVEWGGLKYNFIDTPGLFDFGGEVVEGLSASDMAVIVVDGRAGVEAGTIKSWKLCERYNVPRLFFVTGVDDNRAKYMDTLAQLKELFGKKIAPFHYPIKDGDKFIGFINVVIHEARAYKDEAPGYELIDIPEEYAALIAPLDEMIQESVAETSDELMEKYFNAETFTAEEVAQALKENVLSGEIVPVLLGSGVRKRGIETLLNAIKIYFQSPMGDYNEMIGENTETGELFRGEYDSRKDFSAYVFKTMNDPFIGRYSLVKVCTGKLKSDMVLYNANKEQEEKASKLYILRGNKPIEVDEIKSGDIGAIAKLNYTETGDTLSTKEVPVKYPFIELPKPYTCKAYTASNRGDEDKISQALAKMMQEDLTLRTENDTENRQLLIYGIGEQHLDITVARLMSEYKAGITLHEPKVKFRETIRKRVEVQGKYKKQTGGHGQYGDVKIVFEPSGDLETPYVFEEKIFGGAIPRNYFPAVEKGLQESVLQGPMAGYPVVGLKATLVDGSYHTVDSSELAFKNATIIAFKEGFMKASPVLLEPIMNLKVEVTDDYAGDVIGDLNKRRGRILGMEPIEHGEEVIEAEVPMLELFGYATALRSMTAGNGDFSYEFVRYEQAPEDVRQQIIARREED